MIGMSPAMMGSFWNPRAKNAQLEYNGQPMPFDMQQGPGRIFMPQTTATPNNEINVQGPGLVPSGNELEMPPISPSRNVLDKHMTLPKPNFGGEVSAQMPQVMGGMRGSPFMNKGVARSRNRFSAPTRSAPTFGGGVAGVKRSIF